MDFGKGSREAVSVTAALDARATQSAGKSLFPASAEKSPIEWNKARL